MAACGNLANLAATFSALAGAIRISCHFQNRVIPLNNTDIKLSKIVRIMHALKYSALSNIPEKNNVYLKIEHKVNESDFL